MELLADLDSKNEGLVTGSHRCPDSRALGGKVGVRAEKGRSDNKATNSSLLKEKLASVFFLSKWLLLVGSGNIPYLRSGGGLLLRGPENPCKGQGYEVGQ